MKLTEKILIGFVLVSILLYFNGIVGGALLTILSIFTLACIYCYFSFALLNKIRLRDIFKKISYKNISVLQIIGAVSTGVGLCAALISILFKFLFWPGAIINAFFSIFVLSIVLIISLFKSIKSNAVLYKNVIVRSSIILVLLISVTLTSSENIVNFKYKDYPEYAKAFNNYLNDRSYENQVKWEEEKLIMLMENR
jgi:hypothetical protein